MHIILGFLGTAFWLWMIYDCIQKDPDRHIWLWVLFFTHFPGALLYFLLRSAPRMALPVPSVFGRWSRGRELAEAEAAARNVGNVHNFVELGDILRDIGQTSRAGEVYARALEQAPEDPHALWGAAAIALRRKEYRTAQGHLALLLPQDPDHAYGEASLGYARALHELNDHGAARAHLEQHLRRWSHPEARVRLAALLLEAGETADAQAQIDEVTQSADAVPAFGARNHRYWVRQARRLRRG